MAETMGIQIRKTVWLLGILLFFAQCITAQEWPDWRGINRDAIWRTQNAPLSFAAPHLSYKWTAEVGPGYSGPTVANGKVYLTDKQTTPEDQERILCFDARTGEQLWVYAYNCVYSGVGYPAGPRASVVIHKGKAYALGTMGHLHCLDADDGSVIWEKNLGESYDLDMPIWGIASTPLVVDDKIIVHVSASPDACVVAFHKDTGQELWRSLDERAGYSAPILIEKNGSKVVVNWTEESLSGMNPENGEIYWHFPWRTGSGMSISTPVLYDSYIFVSAFYSGSILVELSDNYKQAKIVWQRSGESERKTDALHCVMNTPVILDDYIYGIDSYGELRCLELLTGDRVWEDQTAVKRDRWANVHFITAGDYIWMFNEQGELLITQLSPRGFNELSRTKLIETTRKQLPRGVCWSHPAFAGNLVFVRNDNKLVCAFLK